MATKSVIAELLIEIGVSAPDAKEAERKIKGVKDEAGDIEKTGGSSLSKFSKGAGVAFAAVAAAAVAAAAAIVKTGKEIFNFVNETTADLDRVAKQARQTGLGAEQYQRLAFAAERSGTTIENVGKASRRIGVQLQEVAQGGGKSFVDSLAAIGLGVEDLEGKTASEQLGLIGDSMNAFATDAEKAAFAAKILGEEAGPQLIPLLNEGTEGIQDLSDAAGDVFTEEELARSEAFQDAMTNFNQVINKVKGDIATALAPAIENIINKVGDWVAENDDFLKQKLPEIIGQIADALVDLLPLIADTIEGIHGFFIEIQQLDERLTNDFGPAWDYVKRSIMAVLQPINAVADAIDRIIFRITEFIQSSEMLMDLAHSVGITAFDKTTNVRGQVGAEGRMQDAQDAREAASKVGRSSGVQATAAPMASAADQKRLNDLMSKAQSKKGVTQREAMEARRLLSGSGLPAHVIDQGNSMIAANTKERRGGRGRGGRSRQVAEEKVEPELKQIATLEEFFALTAQQQSKIAQGMFRMAEVKEPVKPEAIINVTNNTFDIEQIIQGIQDPEQAGRVAARMIKEEFDARLARAAQSAQTNVVR